MNFKADVILLLIMTKWIVILDVTIVFAFTLQPHGVAKDAFQPFIHSF